MQTSHSYQPHVRFACRPSSFQLLVATLRQRGAREHAFSASGASRPGIHWFAGLEPGESAQPIVQHEYPPRSTCPKGLTFLHTQHSFPHPVVNLDLDPGVTFQIHDCRQSRGRIPMRPATGLLGSRNTSYSIPRESLTRCSAQDTIGCGDNPCGASVCSWHHDSWPLLRPIRVGSRLKKWQVATIYDRIHYQTYLSCCIR